MYLHVGGNIVVSMKRILGIFDYSLANSKINAEFLEVCYRDKKKIFVDENLITKSYIITDDEIYYSPIATVTLKKRVSKGGEFNFDNN